MKHGRGRDDEIPENICIHCESGGDASRRVEHHESGGNGIGSLHCILL